jgi:hypothetical protein
MIAKDRLADVEAGGQTATSGGPTFSRRRAAVRSCTTRATAMVEAIVVRAMQCSGCFWRRTVRPHRRQAGTSNLLIYDDVRAMKVIRSIGSTVN